MIYPLCEPRKTLALQVIYLVFLTSYASSFAKSCFDCPRPRSHSFGRGIPSHGTVGIPSIDSEVLAFSQVCDKRNDDDESLSDNEPHLRLSYPIAHILPQNFHSSFIQIHHRVEINPPSCFPPVHLPFKASILPPAFPSKGCAPSASSLLIVCSF